MKDSPFTTLDRYLEIAHHPDGWSDDGVLLAGKMVLDLQPADWQALEQAWPSRNPEWQKRLADCLGDGPVDRSLPILRDMLKSNHESVALEAGNALYSCMTVGHSVLLDQDEINILKRLSARSRLHGMVFAIIIKRFDPDWK